MNGRNFASKRARILRSGRPERTQRKAIAHLAREAGAVPIVVDGKLVAHEMPDGFTVCELRRYRDLSDAAEELNAIRRFAHLQEKRIPARVFPCEQCGGWHLTSRA